MKKSSLISIILIMLASPIWAQLHNNGSSLPDKNNQNRIDEIKMLHAHESGSVPCTNKSENNSPKQLIWQWDTIIAYDTLDFFLERHIQTFDGNGNVATRSVEKWPLNAWENYTLNSFVYDLSGNVITDLMFNWQGSTWDTASRIQYTYDLNNNMLVKLIGVWQSGVWENQYKLTYTYDINGNELTGVSESWQGGAWIYEYLVTNTYDGNGNLLTEIYQMWQSPSWVNFEQTTNTYDTNDHILSSIFAQWGGSSWVNVSKDTFLWDMNGNIVTDYCMDWMGSTWDSSAKFSFTYDLSGNMLTGQNQFWNGSSWDNVELFTWVYDNNNNSVSAKYEGWRYGTWWHDMGFIPVFSQKEIIYELNDVHRYEGSFTSFNSGTQDNLDHAPSFRMYPNPSSYKVLLDFTYSRVPVRRTISIYNSQGQLIKQVISSSLTIEIDISEFINGLYVVFVQEKDKNQTMKLIVE